MPNINITIPGDRETEASEAKASRFETETKTEALGDPKWEAEAARQCIDKRHIVRS